MSHTEMPRQMYDFATNRGGELMISVSGIRGTIPEGLDPVNIVLFARAFSAVTGKKIVIGQDARPTGPILKHLLIGTLLAAGKEVVDIGLAPTPTVKAAVKSLKADGGVMISASHNPPNWNAFKFMDRGGFFFNKKRSAELLEAMADDLYQAVGYKNMGTLSQANGNQAHIFSILQLLPNLNEIKKRKYTVVVDGVAGAGREALPELLRALGCRVVPLFCEADPAGKFPRPPEPTPDALKKFGKLTKESKAAAGFALDPDADRLVTGSQKLGAINEEYTLPLAYLGLLDKKSLQALKAGNTVSTAKNTVVVNFSTATLIDSVVKRTGGIVLRASVGESNVVEEMLKRKAHFGGEGNGGVIHPRVPSYGRDSLTGAALILSAMASLNCSSLDELMELLPPLYMKKSKMELKGVALESVYARLGELFPSAKKNREDGLHLALPDGEWIHARPSNTEPIVRLIVQGASASRLKEILERCSSLFPS